MGEEYVETYLGCEIYFITPPDAAYEVYTSSCITGLYKKISAVKKRICEKKGGDWIDGVCEGVAEPEPPSWELIEVYREGVIYLLHPDETYYFTHAGGKGGPLTYAECIAQINELVEPEPPPEPEVFTCPICGATFSTHAALDYHMEHIHPPEPEPDVLIETYQDVDIYWQPAYNRYRAQVAVGSVAVGATIEEVRGYIDEILGVLEPPPPTTWAWPLNSVQEWFESLWDNVVDAPLTALNSFWTEHILPKLEWVRDQIDITVNWVYDQLEPIVSGIKTNVINMWTELATSISNTLISLSNAITNIGDWIWDKVRPIINTIKTKVTDMWDDLSASVGGVITNITGTIITIKTLIFDKITAKASEIITDIGTALGTVADTLWTAITAGLDTLGTLVATKVDGLWDSLTGLAGDLLSGMATKLGEALKGFWNWILTSLGHIAEMIIGAVQFVMSKVRPIITTLVAYFMELLTGAVTPGSPPKEIEIAAQVLSGTLYNRQVDMIDGAHHSPGTYEELFRVATQVSSSGIAAGGTAMAAAVAADQSNPANTPGFRPTVRELVYWSGIPAVTASIAVLPASVGLITPLRYFLNKRWMPMKPPAVDVIRFSVREVYDPERYDALIANYPGVEYQELMAFNGYAPEFAEHYWMAHWVLPSVSQLNEMLYRGEIDEDRWHDYVVWNDYIPEMVDKLKAIIYHPYTRVDIRRMWDMRVVSIEEVKENYLWLGYDDEHAEKMTLWTKVYTAASDIRALYARGYITGDEVKQSFIDLGVPEARAETFKKKLVTYVGPERTETERDLTKTDILRMLKVGIFTPNETSTFLQDIGYTEAEAAYLIELYQYEPLIELRELTMSQILKSYRYEIYSREETKTALLEAGWAELAAETLLQLEDIKLADAKVERARERDLTRTDIVKATIAGIIDLETSYNYLGYLGYADWEIRVIYALEGIEFPEASS